MKDWTSFSSLNMLNKLWTDLQIRNSKQTNNQLILPELHELLYSFRQWRVEAVCLVSCAHQAEVLVDIRHILPT
jgi:hypothetical protein